MFEGWLNGHVKENHESLVDFRLPPSAEVKIDPESGGKLGSQQFGSWKVGSEEPKRQKSGSLDDISLFAANG